MEKEGETYLDQLLNTVAPDWEDNSKQPEKNSEGAKNEMADNMTTDDAALQDAMDILNSLPDMDDDGSDEMGPDEMGAGLADAMAILNDLPDMEEEEPVQEDAGADADMDELFDLLADTAPETEEEHPVAEDLPDGGPEADVPEETMPVEEEVAEEEIPEEDAPISIDSLPEESYAEPEADVPEETPVSESSVAVDDIFQDALSAVGYSENEEEEQETEDVFSIGDMSDLMDDTEEGVSSVPVAEPAVEGNRPIKKKKGPGFFKRIFGNIITDTTADEEERARQALERVKEKKAAQKEEKKKQAAATKEEKAQFAQEAKERKNQQKAELAARKAEKKEEKKRLKAEQNAEAAKEVVGKINPVGATIVAIFFVTIGLATIFGSKLLDRRGALSDAENYFANEEYVLAYDSISSVDLKEDDEALYRRIRICSQMQKELNSYQNYTSMSMRLEALDSLIKGVRYYDINHSEAQTLGIETAYDKLSRQITEKLTGEFGLGADEARALVSIGDPAEYTMRLQQIAGSN